MVTPSGKQWVARLGLGLALAGTAACDGEVLVTGASLTPIVMTRARVADAGGVMRYEVANRSMRSFGYGACAGSLERREGEAWVDASEPGSRICITIGLTLAPLQTAAGSMQLPEAAGMYRIRFHLSDLSHGRTDQFVAVSNAFEVRAGQ